MPTIHLFTKYIYSIWLISLSFYLYSVVGSLSMDNILAPIVLCFATLKLFFRKRLLPSKKIATILIFVLLFTIYACGRLISVIEHPEYFAHVINLILKQLLYLSIPLIYIDSFEDLFLTLRLMVIVAVIVIFSVLIASVGIYDFPVQRFAESRIGITSLKKAVGFFSNYGDMAMIGSFALLYLYLVEKRKKELFQGFFKYVATILILSGYIGAQSRNMYLTLIIGIISAAYFRITLQKSKGVVLVISLLVVLSCVGMFEILRLNEISTITSLKTFGGTREAAATVDARLGQYSIAWDIIVDRPLFGKGYKIMASGMEIHNLWLGLMSLGGLVSTLPVATMFLFIFFGLLRQSSNEQFGQLKIVGLAQIVCVLVAVEFYGAMTYAFLVIMGTLAMFPVILANTN